MEVQSHENAVRAVVPRVGYADRVRDYLRESAKIKCMVADSCVESVVAAADLITETFTAGGKLLLCGNGGSAADCQHMATELLSRLTKDFERPGLPAIALTTDTSFLTAFSNDYEFDGVFARQVQALGREGDLLLGISTSGNSPNVIRALKAARESNMKTVILTGQGGRAAGMADLAIVVPSTDTQFIQESHLAIEHILCDLVERSVFDSRATPEVRRP
jgi:D-sedoheptulose 7-phosphate isomerase